MQVLGLAIVEGEEAPMEADPFSATRRPLLHTLSATSAIPEVLFSPPSLSYLVKHHM